MKKKVFFGVIFFIIIFTSLQFMCFSAYADSTIISNKGSTLYSVNTPQGFSSKLCTDAPFKNNGDSTVFVSGTSTIDTSGDTTGYNYLNLGIVNKIGTVKTYKKLTIRFDVLLTQNNTGIGFRAKQANDDKKTYFKLFAGKDIKANTWNRVAFVIGADGNDNSYSLYINGKKISDGYTAAGAYGMETISWLITHCAKDKYFEMYLDNVLVTAGDTGYVTGGSSVITSVSNGITLKDNAVMVYDNTAFSSIRSSISTTSENDNIAFYHNDGSAVSDASIAAEGDVVTLTNAEGITETYEIKIKAKALYNADGSSLSSVTSSKFSIAYGISDAPLKSSVDTVYMLSTASSVSSGTVSFPTSSLIPQSTDGYATFNFDYCAAAPGDYISIGEKKLGSDVLFLNRWHKISCVYELHAQTVTEIKVYLNGNLFCEYTPENALAWNDNMNMTFGNTLGVKSKMYLDNIELYFGNEAMIKTDISEILYFANELKVDNEIKVIYGASDGNVASDIKSSILSDKSAIIMPVNENGFLLDDNASLYAGCGAVVLSNDGIYTYYRIMFFDRDDDSYKLKDISKIPPCAVSAGFSKDRYSVVGTSVDVNLIFNSDLVIASSITKNNITVTSDTGIFSDYTLTVIGNGSYASAVKISFNNLKTAEKYIIHVANIKSKYSSAYQQELNMSSEQIITFATAPGNGDTHYANIINNALNENAWKEYGGLPKLTGAYDQGNYVITASGRKAYYHGIMEHISMDEILKISGDNYASGSEYMISFNIKSASSNPANEPIVASLVWQYYENGEYIREKLLNINFTNLKQDVWQKFSLNQNINIPTKLEGKDNVSLYIHFEGEKNATTFSNFYISDFCIKKVFTGNTFDLTLNENTIENTVDDRLYGYCIEGGTSWWSDYSGEAIIKNTNQWKPEFLEFMKDLNIKTFRFGGYTANFEFWKTSLGNIEDRIPAYAPAPDWDTKPYWRDGIEYIATMERMQLAETSSPDATVIMCVNMWSYLKDIDYSKKYTTPITPSYVVKNNVIDKTALEIVTKDIIDYIRFCTLMPDDPRAVGFDGINWAQKRVDLGHGDPYKVDIWELGNELFYRGLNGDTYVQMCEYIIPEIRKIFPKVKIAVHIDESGSSYRWREYVIDNLAQKVEYIAFHSYYDYNGVAHASNVIDTVEKMAKAKNPNVKFVLTEGGLANFRNYVGPSNRSVIMPVAFADYMNRTAKKSVVESFEYFGTARQICYDYTNSVKRGWKSSYGTQLNDENGFIELTERKSYNSGMWQDISYSDFKANGHAEGESCDYDFELYFKTASDSESFKIDANWVYDTGIVQNIYSKTLTPGDYTKGEWIKISDIIRNVKYPEQFDGNKTECLRIIIAGAETNTLNSAICVRDISLKILGTDRNVASNIIADISTEPQRMPTGLGEVMKYYTQKGIGQILKTDISNAVISKHVSAMAVKDDDGIRLFLANRNESMDYTINLDSVCGTKYTMTESYVMHSEDLYAERDTYKDDIYTDFNEYNSGEEIKSITLPALSVLIVKLTDISKFVPFDIFENKGITIKYVPQTSVVSIKSDELNKDVNVYVASYRDEKLNDIVQKTVSLNTQYTDFSVDELDADGCDCVKIYVWSNNSILFPYCESFRLS